MREYPDVVFAGLLEIAGDESIMIVDNLFYKTAQNLMENNKISVL